MTTATWATEELRTLDLGDRRRTKRYIQLLDTAVKDSSASIAKLGKDYHQSKAYYRLLSNPAVDSQTVLSAHEDQLHTRISKQPIVLCIQDTTEIQTDRLSATGMGRLNYDARKGYYTHTTLITDTNGIPLGIYDNWHWARKPKGHITIKESRRWIEGYQRICELSDQHPTTTHLYVADRESDMMDIIQYGHQQQHPADYLLRARHNRVLQDGSKLFDVTDEDIMGEVQFHIPTRQGQSGRAITQSVFVKRVKLTDGIPITLIVSRELNPPKGKKAIEWKLITNQTITSFEQAVTMIDYYRKRWQIEVLFHVLKTGCRIESRPFGSFDTHERALMLYLLVSYRILLMTMLARQTPNVNCEVLFGTHEWQVAYKVRYRKPPSKKPISLRDMVRLIAGFGGFLGRKSDKEPGVKTLWLGLAALNGYCIGASCG